jgi:hypothetical protein
MKDVFVMFGLLGGALIFTAFYKLIEAQNDRKKISVSWAENQRLGQIMRGYE